MGFLQSSVTAELVLKQCRNNVTTYKVDTQHSDTMAPGIREVSQDQPLWTTIRILMILDHLLIFRFTCNPGASVGRNINDAFRRK